MKIKYLILVSLILAILTMGIVSASDENLTVSDDNLEVQDDVNDAELSVSKDNFTVDFESNVDSQYSDVIEIEAKQDSIANCTFNVYVNNSLVKTNNSNSLNYNCHDLGINSSGKYAILVNFTSSNETITLIDDTLTLNLDILTPGYVENSIVEFFSYVDVNDLEDSLGYVESEESFLSGTISVTINGKQHYLKNVTAADQKHIVYLNVSNLNIRGFSYGRYLVNITYIKSNGKIISKKEYVNFTTVPEVFCPDSMSIGENDGLIIKGNESISGKLTLYYADKDYNRGAVYVTSLITNGYARIPFDNLTSGQHFFCLDYTFGTYSYSDDYYSVNVNNNTQGFTSNISASTLTAGDSVNVTLSGIASNDNVQFFIDGDCDDNKTVKFTNGSVNIAISNLSVGTHYIKVLHNGDNYFSTTHVVTVKAKLPPVVEDKIILSLKKVKVKKSAKKLTLTAVLKINGKAVSGKKIKFKFNKKTLTAKTNKKGVAKVKVTKKILKKLKAGKKVSYQAIYGKTVKKVSVKVKK